jgi:hypothetical protein
LLEGEIGLSLEGEDEELVFDLDGETDLPIEEVRESDEEGREEEMALAEVAEGR